MFSRFAFRRQSHSPSDANNPVPSVLARLEVNTGAHLDVMRLLTERVEALEQQRSESEPQPKQSSSPNGWPASVRSRLEDKALFVVGGARSGTTILYESLNLATDVYLMGEAYLYMDACHPNFVDHLQQRHTGWGNVKSKGHYLPRIPGNGFDVLQELATRYRYVGEKIAFGSSVVTEPDHGERFLAFHATHFFHSHYILIVRHPQEVISSMSAKWPDLERTTVISMWLMAVRLVLELSLTFPNSRFISLDRLDEESIARLGRELGLEVRVPLGRFDREFQPSFASRDKLPPRFEDYRSTIDRMAHLFDVLTGAFDPETFKYCGRENPRAWGQKLWNTINDLLAESRSPNIGRLAG